MMMCTDKGTDTQMLRRTPCQLVVAFAALMLTQSGELPTAPDDHTQQTGSYIFLTHPRSRQTHTLGCRAEVTQILHQVACRCEAPADRPSLAGWLALGVVYCRLCPPRSLDKKLVRQLLGLHQQVSSTPHACPGAVPALCSSSSRTARAA